MSASNYPPGVGTRDIDSTVQHECVVCGKRFIPIDEHEDTCPRCQADDDREDE